MEDTYYPEYDPTPYGGGFDLEEIYGKHNSPSEKSCYSPTHIDDQDLTSLRDDDDDKLSVISAYGVEIPEFNNAHNSEIHTKEIPTMDSTPLAQEEHSESKKKSPNDTQQHTVSKPEELKPDSERNGEPNYPLPECHQRDSDLALCARCGMPLYCYCGCQIFNLETSEIKEGSYDQESTEDVADKVSRWLFSSSYI